VTTGTPGMVAPLVLTGVMTIGGPGEGRRR